MILPKGTRIVKVNAAKGEGMPVGSLGTIVGTDIQTPYDTAVEMIESPEKWLYILKGTNGVVPEGIHEIEWDDKPGEVFNCISTRIEAYQ